MRTTTGTGSTTLQFGGAPHQMAINNLDAAASLNVKVNSDPTGFTVEAGGKRGWRINKGIYDVTITATGSWELTEEY